MKPLYIHTGEIHNYRAPREVIPYVVQHLHPQSILDVGCGLGHWLSVAKECGIENVLGLDGNYVDRSLLTILPSEFLEYDLNRPFFIDGKFDLVLCLEVAEHLPENSAGDLIASLCRHGDTVLFSAAIPNQGGQHHVNEQWPQYWAELFQKNGFNYYDILRPVFWDNEKVDLWYRQNMILFSKKNLGSETEIAPKNKLYSLVHPEMLKVKQWEVNHLQSQLDTAIKNPGVWKSWKMLRFALSEKIKKIMKQISLY